MSKMTRENFEALARAIRFARYHAWDAEMPIATIEDREKQIDCTMRMLAEECKASNRTFDRDRFYDACRLPWISETIKNVGKDDEECEQDEWDDYPNALMDVEESVSRIVYDYDRAGRLISDLERAAREEYRGSVELPDKDARIELRRVGPVNAMDARRKAREHRRFQISS